MDGASVADELRDGLGARLECLADITVTVSHMAAVHTSDRSALSIVLRLCLLTREQHQLLTDILGSIEDS